MKKVLSGLAAIQRFLSQVEGPSWAPAITDEHGPIACHIATVGA